MEKLTEYIQKMKIGSQKVGIIYDPITKLHKHSFEKQKRAESIIEYFNKKQLLNHKNVEYVDKIIPATHDQVSQVHNQNQLKELKDLPQDTQNAAYLAAGSTIMAADKVMQNQWNSAFCVIRPPGHHMSMQVLPENGFCFMNNIVICAKYLEKQYNLKRIAIVDWDIHFGDGTHSFVEQDSNLLFISIHEYDNGTFYPGTGSYNNLGIRKGYCINIPWDIDEDCYPGNQEYIYSFERLILPILRNYQPEIILVSAGFDSAKDDLLGNAAVTRDGFWYMTKSLMKLVQDKVILVLEGGYNLQSIQWAAEASLLGLLHQKSQQLNESKLPLKKMRIGCNPNKVGLQAIGKCVYIQKQFWPFLIVDEKLKKYQLTVQQNIINDNPFNPPKYFIFTNKLMQYTYQQSMHKFYQQLIENQNSQELQLLLQKYAIKFIGQKQNFLQFENIFIDKNQYEFIEIQFNSDYYYNKIIKKPAQEEIFKKQQLFEQQIKLQLTGFNIVNFRKILFDPKGSQNNQQILIEQFFFDYNYYTINQNAILEFLELISKLQNIFEKQQQQICYFDSLSIYGLIDTQNQSNYQFKIFFHQQLNDENQLQPENYENIKIGIKNLISIMKLLI